MWILKFKSQLMIAFFAAVNHLNGPLRKQNFTLTGSKGHGLWFVIGGFRSVLYVSVRIHVLMLVACDRNYDWRQRKTQSSVGFWTSEFTCLWKAQLSTVKPCLIQTPHYNGQFALSLGKALVTFSKFNLLNMDTPLIQTISTVEYKVEKLK